MPLALSRCRRQLDRCDEYSPSRRRAPDAGNPHVRCDEGAGERPLLPPTLPLKKDLKADADAERELDVMDACVGDVLQTPRQTEDVADDTEPEVAEA